MIQRTQPLQRKAIQQLLVQVSEQGTLLRLDSETETYYVLTATQLQQLLQSTLAGSPDETDLPDDHAFTLEDFGLTTTDVATYEAAQARQRSYLKSGRQRP